LLGGGDFGGADGWGSAFGATGIEEHAGWGEVANESWGQEIPCAHIFRFFLNPDNFIGRFIGGENFFHHI